ncbi:hypothetical protein VTH06DRAFT_1887 [Thermothelomyces fergusii]
MPPIERDAPRDPDRPMKHHHSASDHGRALVPMWDSSDPERAPPPLPLNPQSPGVSRAGTSPAIQSAHAAMAEKARESATLVPHLPKRAEQSPEKPALRPSSHRRMQSLQTPSVKDLSLMIEAGSRDLLQSTPRSPEKGDRPTTPQRRETRDSFMESRDDRQDRPTNGTPTPGPSLTPIIRPTAVRRTQQSILGENTPPQSATMLALQSMSNHGNNNNNNNNNNHNHNNSNSNSNSNNNNSSSSNSNNASNNSSTNNNNNGNSSASIPAAKEPEAPLANITNGSRTPAKPPGTLESLSNQILILTDIATALQKEMALLSRRSRDNATDLLSLKEATSSRDEDIRKSLRELISDVRARSNGPRDSYGGPLLADGKHPPSSPTLSKSARPFSLPRIPSPNSFAASFDRESMISTPSLVSDAPSPSTVALLEKIIREMGTKEGQETLLNRLAELADKLSGLATAGKVEELVRFVKDSQQRAVVPVAAAVSNRAAGGDGDRNWGLDDDDDERLRRGVLDYLNAPATADHAPRLLPGHDRGAEVLSNEILQAIRSVKDSVAQGGGLTAETKALVRELRGEVLGMGREIGRRLDEIAEKHADSSEAVTKAEMIKVVEDGLSEMSQKMSDLLREHRCQSAAAAAPRESSIDYKEIYNSVRAALKDTQAAKPRTPEIRREDVIQAVKDAWEEYKPEIEIQQIGLERDEVLSCLEEGLRAYAAQDDRPRGATRDEVFQAVVEGLKHYVPPKLEAPPTLSRDDVLEAVRECLEEFKFPVAPGMGSEITRDDMLDAVKEGLQSFDFSVPQSSPAASALTKGDVLDAVNQGLQSFDFSATIPRPDLSRVDVADAVKEGFESFDLDNRVTLAVKQALGGFDFSSAPSSALVPHGSASRDLPREDIFMPDAADAVKEGLRSADLTRDVAAAVKAALEAFDFSGFSSALVARPVLSRADVVNAVREGLDVSDLSRKVADAVKGVLERLDLPAATASGLSRGGVVDAVQEGLGSLDISASLSDAVEKALNALDLSAVQSTPLVARGGGNDEVMQRLHDIKEQLLAEIKASSEETREDIAANALGTEQVIDATKEGFEKLRQDIEDYVGRAKEDSGSEQVLDHLLGALDDFRTDLADLVKRSADSSRAFLKEEVDSLRDIVNSSMIPAIPQPGGNKEVLEALHDGLHALRSEISARRITGLTEILDALQEGLGDIRISLNNLRDKPADLTANDEILEALREGLDSVRNDINALREERKNERALTTVDDESKGLAPGEQTLKHDDIRKLEALITQLGTKVEAVESAPKPAVTSLSKEDLADMEKTIRNIAESVAALPNRESFELLEESIRGLQKTVDDLAGKEAAPPRPAPSNTDPASREDVEAIETILRNTKARLDEFMDDEQMARKDHIESLETLILEARESVNGLSTQFDGAPRKEQIDAVEALLDDTRQSLAGLATQVDNLSRKEDVAKVESLVNQIVAAFDEMKERHEKALEDPERITKTDVEAVEAVCLDTKSIVEHIQKVDLVGLPSKEDVENLEVRLGEVKARLDSVADASAKSFEERQAEIVGVGVTVNELKVALEEFRGLIGSKLEDGARGVDSIHNILDALSCSVRRNDNIGERVKEVLDTVRLEFEDAKTGMIGVKMELDEKLQTISATVVTKLDERMSELTTKYEEFQLVQDGRAAKSEARDAELEAAVNGTKAVAEELKALVDTLGTAVTDSMEKMEEASKTVFERVEDLVAKSDENRADGKAEHQLTREQVQEAIGKVAGLQGQVSECQHKILDSVQEAIGKMEGLQGQHYENLRTSTSAIQEKVDNPEKYDDTVVIEKLDTLVSHTQVANKAFEHLETLDQVHAQVKATAAELAAFLAAETQRIADEREDREKTLQETTIALERRREEKEQVEALIAGLREEEARLKESITVTLPEEQNKITEQFLINLMAEESRLKEATAALIEEQAQLKETFLANLKEEQARLMEANVSLKEEHDKIQEVFLNNLKEEQARLMEMNVALKEEQDKLKEVFLSNLREEESRLKEVNDALREEQRSLKDTFLANLREEQSLLKAANASLRQEQEDLKKSFLAHLREEEQRLRGANEALRQEHEQIKATLKEEQEQLKTTLLANLKEEEQRLRDTNEALRQEQEQVKATLKEEQEQLKVELLANLKEEGQRLRDANEALRREHEQTKAILKEEQEQFKVELLTSLKEEEQRLRETNEALRREQEQIKATLKEEQERFKVELLANLMEEEARLKEANATLREEQEQLRVGFFAMLKEEESRMKETLLSLRAEQETLARQKARLTADLSSLDTALRLRREELHDMEARAESLERRILEGVLDHSRVLLMTKTNRVTANNSRDSMSRKRVTSAQKSVDSGAPAPNGASAAAKPRSALTLALSARSKASTPNGGSPSSSNRRILSLSQITNNVPLCGVKRSQSVRTAGGPAASRGLRKSSWTSSTAAAAAASKRYGDLGLGLGDDKENMGMGMDLKEGDEDAYNGQDRRVSREPSPSVATASVDIVVSSPTVGSSVDDPRPVDVAVRPPTERDEDRRQVEELVDDEDRFSDLGNDAELEREEGHDDARSLRRSSHGTTVVMPSGGHELEEHDDWTEHEGDAQGAMNERHDDVYETASDWTESVVGPDGDVGDSDPETSAPVTAAA